MSWAKLAVDALRELRGLVRQLRQLPRPRRPVREEDQMPLSHELVEDRERQIAEATSHKVTPPELTQSRPPSRTRYDE